MIWKSSKNFFIQNSNILDYKKHGFSQGIYLINYTYKNQNE